MMGKHINDREYRSADQKLSSLQYIFFRRRGSVLLNNLCTLLLDHRLSMSSSDKFLYLQHHLTVFLFTTCPLQTYTKKVTHY